MIGHKYHLDFFVTQLPFFKTIDDLETGLMFIIPPDHLIIHASCTRYVARSMVRVGSAKDWNVSLRLCPGRGICRVCVRDAANSFPMLVQKSMRFCIRGWPELSIYSVCIVIDDHHLFG